MVPYICCSIGEPAFAALDRPQAPAYESSDKPDSVVEVFRKTTAVDRTSINTYKVLPRDEKFKEMLAQLTLGSSSVNRVGQP